MSDITRVNLRISPRAATKARSLNKYLSYQSSKTAWSKDANLLRSNLLETPTSKNYTVLNAFGRQHLRGKKAS